MKVWILTREINCYDQDGEYFVDVFANVPSFEQLTAAGVPENRIKHTQKGGGRLERSYEWFILREIEVKP